VAGGQGHCRFRASVTRTLKYRLIQNFSADLFPFNTTEFHQNRFAVFVSSKPGWDYSIERIIVQSVNYF
jgi:hypothetical protein